MLERLRKIVGALAQLVEQPRVLDGDDGLVRKRFYERDLFIREWFNLEPVNGDCSN